jgi:small subunit ribosomal protein S15
MRRYLMLTKEEKIKVIEEYGRGPNDCGSVGVQIALLSEEIRRLTEHLKIHKHDFHSQRGLMKKVGRRKRLLRYLQNEDPQGYKKLIEKLGIRG